MIQKIFNIFLSYIFALVLFCKLIGNENICIYTGIDYSLSFADLILYLLSAMSGSNYSHVLWCIIDNKFCKLHSLLWAQLKHFTGLTYCEDSVNTFYRGQQDRL